MESSRVVRNLFIIELNIYVCTSTRNMFLFFRVLATDITRQKEFLDRLKVNRVKQ